MATIFGKWNIRWNLERLVFTHTLCLKNFAEIALSGTVFEIQAFLCFAKNSKIQDGRHFWWDKIFFENWVTYLEEIPYGSKISSKSLYLAQFSRYKHFWKKIRKFKMAAIFGNWNIRWNLERLVFTDTLWVKNFAEIPLVNFYFMKKMVSKSTHISVLFYLCTLWAYISNFVFCIFCQKFENWIWPPFWGRRNFLENWRD